MPADDMNFFDAAPEDHGEPETERQNVIPFPGAEEVPGRPCVLVLAGELDVMATEGERAIAVSAIDIFQRGRELVRPVQQEVPASKGRMTISAGLASVTQAGMTDVLCQAAEWRKYDGRSKKRVRVDPPSTVAAIILSRVGRWTFPTVAGVITTPTLRPDGTVLHKPGYDPVTRLFQVVDPSLVPSYIPAEPTKQDAEAALAVLDKLVDEFPFVGAADRSVALSAIMTPIVRGAVPVAPLHAIRASTAGTGKSYLADTASAIATGRPCPVVSVSPRPEETESRLVGLMLAAFPLISLDNVNGELGGDLLCQAVERPTVRVRRLGASDIFEIESRATFFATGNGLRVKGDMTRRTVICNLDAGLERPEERQFTHNPVDDVIKDRGAYVAAILVIVRAYIVAGMPGRLPRLASFEDWSDMVRSPLVWLGMPDPVKTMEAAREDDPELGMLRDLLVQWDAAIGKSDTKTCKQLADIAGSPEKNEHGETVGKKFPDLFDAVLAVSGARKDIDNRRLGIYLKSIEGRIANGLRVKRSGTDSHSSRRFGGSFDAVAVCGECGELRGWLGLL